MRTIRITLILGLLVFGTIGLHLASATSELRKPRRITRIQLGDLSAAPAAHSPGDLHHTADSAEMIAAESGDSVVTARELLSSLAGDSLVRDSAILDAGFRLAVSLGKNRLYVLDGESVVREIVVATGKNKTVRFGERQYEFRTPAGVHEVLKKDVNPIWIAPDWHWHEQGLAVPEEAASIKGRRVKGVLGKFRLRLGDGLGIHGTNEPESLGKRATHGCVRVGEKDLAFLFAATDTGTRVYIF